ncbi:hypothetical protein LSCM1_03566 [Leishmania martiniquensis]|uniref:Uncharacterized protein n=1 Tax=Leishmania martiniquensis TaxID=1580590 RepID=A0A836KIG8_9TRYP|nr:hypothetical protein LSCM1_03566 [Leishmania martiniquensis]
MPTTEATRSSGRHTVLKHEVLAAQTLAGATPASGTTAAPGSEAAIHTALLPDHGGVSPQGYSSSCFTCKSVSSVPGPHSARTCTADSSVDVAHNRSPAAAAAAVSAATLRGLRGQLNEGAADRAPHPSAALQMSARGHNSMARLLLLSCSERSLLAHAAMAASTRKATPSASAADVGAARESVQVTGDASLRKAWAANFTNTATVRNAVSTSTEAYTAFEEELVREVNELRRAPAAYAAIVEREVTIGAPYVQEDDLYFCDESAAENAATELRRQLEEQYCLARVEAASATGAAGSRGSAHVVSPKTGLQTGHEKRKGKKGFASSPSVPALSTGSSSGSAAPRRISRASPASERQSTHKAGLHGSSGLPSRWETVSPELPGGGVTVAGTSAVSMTPSTLRSNGLHELTLSQLRHQFRCQQRYRAALEVALRDMRLAQQQAEAAQQAAWASEDERALKKGRRFLTPNTLGQNMNPSPATLYGNNATESSVSAVVPHGNKKLSYSSTTSLLAHGGGTSDDPLVQRRNEDLAQLRSVHEARIQHMAKELCDVCNACQRSLAAANLVLDAVRVLREAQPAPLVQHHRGLSLAARDTAETYYGDEERVAALQDLFAVSRATLVRLAEYMSAATTPLSTLEQLSRRLGERQGEEARAKVTNSSALHGMRNRMDVDEGSAREPSGTEAVPSWVLPLLSEEASLLASVTKNACATYGYISGEVRGLHLQAGPGSPRSLLLQMIVGSLTPVLGFSNHSLPQSSDHAARRTSAPSMAHSINVTQCYAGVRIEGRVYAAADAPAGTSDTAERARASQLRAAPSQRGMGEREGANEALAVWSGKEGAPFEATEYKSSSGGNGATTATSHAQRAAAAAAQRLWPLLWAGAYTIGCGWQQVSGWRRVPTFAEACEERQVASYASSCTASSRGMQPPFAEKSHAAICTTLLFASGFEEYEVVRGCRHMSPAAARRVVRSTPAAMHDGGPQSTSHSVSIADAVEARRAAVDVHSTLGVTLLTPTMHPMHIHASDSSCRIVCVAVRVPLTSPDSSVTHSPMCAVEDERMRSDGRHDPSIRIVAQVTRQYEPTPPHPTTSAAEVLSQRSPVDPSVWLVLVDTAAAFQRHAVASTGSGGAALNEDGLRDAGALTVPAAGAAVPLSLHLYAKDMNDPMGEFEHVAFIRMQQYPKPVEVNTGAVAVAASGVSSAHTPSVLMAPEWRYLLNGLAGMAASPLSIQRATGLTTTSHTAAQTSVLSRTAPTPPTAASTGWVTLHEPLLGRDGVLLCPLSVDLRESERSGGAPEALQLRQQLSGDRGGEAAAVAGRAICVAVQLPANCNERWRHRRLSTLRRLRRKLAEEVAAEGDEEAVASTAQSPTADGTPQGQSPQSPVEAVDQPLAEVAGSSDEAGAGATGAALGDSDLSGGTATAVAASAPTSFPLHSSASAGGTGTAAGAAGEGSSADAEGAPGPSKGTAAEGGKTCSEGERAAKKFSAAGKASGGGAKSRYGSSLASGGLASTSKRRAPAARTEHGGAVASSATALSAAATTGPFSAAAPAHRHPLSASVMPELPESAALREYVAMTERAAAEKLVASSRGNVQACLQPSVISIPALRELTGRLRADLDVREAYLARVQPILAGERDRIAAEITKKKGKELLRLQHDHEDLVCALQLIDGCVVSLREATTAASGALRTRERTQVLRRARLVRIADELCIIESSLPLFALKGANGNAGTAPSLSTIPQSAAPKVTLRFFNTAAVAAGSGCNMAFSAVRPQRCLPARRSGVLDGTSHGGVAKLAGEVPDEVALVRQPSFARGAGSSSSPSPQLEGGGEIDSAVDVYAVTCAIPPTFAGCATLCIDDEIAATWFV